jgi:hypothetical protein
VLIQVTARPPLLIICNAILIAERHAVWVSLETTTPQSVQPSAALRAFVTENVSLSTQNNRHCWSPSECAPWRSARNAGRSSCPYLGHGVLEHAAGHLAL